jgi:hypothetical protein
VGKLAFSPDGSRLGYIARDGEEMSLFIDDRPVHKGKGLGDPVFASKGERFAYAVKAESGWSVTVDGAAGPSRTRLGDYAPSPAKACAAVVYEEKGKWRVDHCGRPEGPYDAVGRGTLSFDPAGRALAYSALRKGKWEVVIDGAAGRKYDGIMTLGGAKILFPGEGRVRYLAVSGKRILSVEEKY